MSEVNQSSASAVLERVYEEKRQLEDRADKLADFICSEKFNETTPHHQSLLRTQLQIMSAYSQVLLERIELFESEQQVPE